MEEGGKIHVEECGERIVITKTTSNKQEQKGENMTGA